MAACSFGLMYLFCLCAIVKVPVVQLLMNCVSNCPIRPNSPIAAYERTARCKIISQVDLRS